MQPLFVLLGHQSMRFILVNHCQDVFIFSHYLFDKKKNDKLKISNFFARTCIVSFPKIKFHKYNCAISVQSKYDDVREQCVLHN